MGDVAGEGWARGVGRGVGRDQLCSRRLCHDEIFERVEVGERGRAVRHTGPVTLLARTPTRAPFSSPEGRPHQQAPNRDSMISGMGRWRLRVECL